MAKVESQNFMASPQCAKNEVKKLLNRIIEEQRDFTNNEKQRFNTYYEFLSQSDKQKFDNLIREMNTSIFNIEIRENKNQNQLEMRNEKGDKMKNNNQEYLQEFRSFLQDPTRKNYTEQRAGESLVANNGAVVPQYLVNEVVKILNEQSSLFADMKTYATINGELSVPREKAGNMSDLVFVGENVKLTPTALQFDAVKIQTKRCGTAVKISDQFIQESGVDLVPYVMELLTRRLTKGLDYHAIKGNESIEGLDTLTHETHGVVVKQVPAIKADDFVDMVAGMNPVYLAGAKFVMNRKMFAAVSKLVDGAGAYLLVLNFQQDRPVYKILGVEVQISDAMDDNKVYLVNMQEAYAKVIRNAIRVKRVDGDEENALSAMNLFILDMFVGAKCVCGEAVVRLVVQG